MGITLIMWREQGKATLPPLRRLSMGAHERSFVLLDREPGFRSSVIFEYAVVRALADKFIEGARLLGLPK